MLITACSDDDCEGVGCCLSDCDAVESFTQLLVWWCRFEREVDIYLSVYVATDFRRR